MKNMIYGYARISTMKQSIKRQIENIKSRYPDAYIISEAYTGTKIERPAFSKLIQNIKPGDTIVFDEVSRMSRNADEGFKLYRELYEKGVNLVFLKESPLNTENFKNAMQIEMTGTDVDMILEGVNKYLMALAENQIKAAFQTAQHEVDYLRQRTVEGMRVNGSGDKIRAAKLGKTVTTKKGAETKEIIKKHCREFGGSLSDVEVMQLAGVARNTFYKYKRELKSGLGA